MRDSDSTRELTPPRSFREQFRAIHEIRVGRVSNLWLYVRYQVLSKLLVSIVVFPAYNWAVRKLIASTGRSTINSSDVMGFLWSIQGAVAVLLSAAFVLLVMCLDIAAFVQLELRRLQGEPLPTARRMLLDALRLYPSFLHPGSLVLLAYVVILIPLVGFGPEPSVLEWLKIPNFVMDVIIHNPAYLTAYVVAIALLGVLSFFLFATFPAMLVHGHSPWGAMRESLRYMRRYWLINLVWLVIYLVTVLLIVGVTLAVLGGISLWGIPLVAESLLTIRFTTLLAALIAAGAVGLILLFLTPSMLRELTRVYAVLHDDSPVRPEPCISTASTEDRRARPRLFAAVVVAVAGSVIAAGIGAWNFDDLFRSEAKIEVVAHRGGGDLDAENTVQGVEAAAAIGAQWSEIDVQRTLDGQYVINHDSTFSRVAGESRAAEDMTLAEIKSLQVENGFAPSSPSRPVATLEDMLTAAKGKIRLFIELKGATADRRMVDDVAALIRQHSMENEAAIISLDQGLIEYAEQKNPDLLTGFLYFFAVGDTENLPADYLMMEEQVATETELLRLNDAGKKTVVWTVNTEASIAKYTVSSVGGIITDHPQQVIQALTERSLRSDLELIVEQVLNFG